MNANDLYDISEKKETGQGNHTLTDYLQTTSSSQCESLCLINISTVKIYNYL